MVNRKETVYNIPETFSGNFICRLQKMENVIFYRNVICSL